LASLNSISASMRSSSPCSPSTRSAPGSTTRYHAGNLYEIGVVNSLSGPVVIHAMTARPKFLE
jgi:hypothetical protein